MSDHPPAWHPDPTGRHELRYWDGQDFLRAGTSTRDLGVDSSSYDPYFTEHVSGYGTTERGVVFRDLPPGRYRVTSAVTATGGTVIDKLSLRTRAMRAEARTVTGCRGGSNCFGYCSGATAFTGAGYRCDGDSIAPDKCVDAPRRDRDQDRGRDRDRDRGRDRVRDRDRDRARGRAGSSRR